MPKFKVLLEQTFYAEYEVEAEDANEAMRHYPDDLSWEATGDAIDVSVEEVV